MSAQTDAPALVRELRQAARKRDALADAYARRAKKYRDEAAEMRAVAAQVRRRLRRSETAPESSGVTARASVRGDGTTRSLLTPEVSCGLPGQNGNRCGL
jgi:hypothetical protein